MDAHVRAPNFVGAPPASPVRAGKVARRWRQPGVQRHNGRLCGTRRRSCLHAGKRGQIRCRPFFTTFLLPRRLSYLSRSIGCNLLARLFARFPYPLFILAPFSLRLADILASSRVCCGSAVPSSQGVMRASENRGPGRDDRYRDRATMAKSVRWPLFFVSALVTARENFYVIKTSSTVRSSATVK